MFQSTTIIIIIIVNSNDDDDDNNNNNSQTIIHLIDFLQGMKVCLCGFRGTPGWIAPEMFVQNLLTTQKLKSTVSAAADVYAAGWVFFEVLCGLSPLLFQDAKTDDDFAAGSAMFIK